MKKLALSISVGMLAMITFSAPTLAQSYAGGGSIKIDKNGLEKVHSNVSPKIYQILDDGPQIHDLRTPPPVSETVDFNLQPMQAGPGKHYVYGDPNSGGGTGSIQLTGTRNNLPFAGPTSNIPANPHINQNLPNGHSVPIVGSQNSPTTSTGQKAVSGTLAPPKQPQQAQNAMSYPSYPSSGSGSSSAGNRINANATGVILKAKEHPLLNKLNR